MTVDSASFLERYPHFSGIDEIVIEKTISLNNELVPTNLWTNEIIREEAISLLTAHTLTLDYYEQLNLGNQLRLTEIGDKIEHRDLSKQTYYSLTYYGLQYQRLRAQFLGLAICVPPLI